MCILESEGLSLINEYNDPHHPIHWIYSLRFFKRHCFPWLKPVHTALTKKDRSNISVAIIGMARDFQWDKARVSTGVDGSGQRPQILALRHAGRPIFFVMKQVAAAWLQHFHSLISFWPSLIGQWWMTSMISALASYTSHRGLRGHCVVGLFRRWGGMARGAAGRNTKNPPVGRPNPFDNVICFRCTVKFICIYIGLYRATRPKTWLWWYQMFGDYSWVAANPRMYASGRKLKLRIFWLA